MAKRSKEKPKRPRKKVFLFLVEGMSDKIALEAAFTHLLEDYDEEIIVDFCQRQLPTGQIGGDITSDLTTTPENIEHRLYKYFVDPELQETGLYAKDLTEIIQIVDLDGAYIPDECITQHPARDPYSTVRPNELDYFDDHIEAVDPEQVMDRNWRKRKNLEHLRQMTELKVDTKTIPYSVYYFSANLDHVLHNDANLTSEKKCQCAADFAYGTDVIKNLFVDTMCNDALCDGLDYDGSWLAIRKGVNSLQAHTNLGILIRRIQSMAEEAQNGQE